MQIIRFPVGASGALLAAVCLAACSSESGPSFDEMATRGLALANRAEGFDSTPVDNMPTEGTATYRGIAAFALDVLPEDAEEVDILSELTLNANFGDSSLTGGMDNFRDFKNEEIAGSLAIRNGVISGNGFAAEAAGTLGWQGEEADVALDMLGGFGGENAEMVRGIMVGGAVPTISDPFSIYGEFIAER